jgi:uncharacterized membrane protein
MYLVIVIIAVSLLAIDGAYLSLIAPHFGKMIASVQGSPMSIRIAGAVLCYVALTFVLYWFIIREKRSAWDAFLLGLSIYAVYETTSYATLRKWNPTIAVIDTLWGGVLFGLATTVVYWVMRHLKT